MSLARPSRHNTSKPKNYSLESIPNINHSLNNQKARRKSSSPSKNGKILTRNTSLLAKKTIFKLKANPKPIQNLKNQNQILQNIKAIMNQTQTSFEQIWCNFLKALTDHFKFIGLSIKPISDVGQQLAKNGEFIIKFYELIIKDSFVNPRIACKTIYTQYQSVIEQKKEMFISYFQEKLSTITPQKTSGQFRTSLKRSILKSRSVKKNVSFPRKSSQIKYPMNIEYSNQKNLSIERKKMHRKRIHQSILQFLQIDDFFMLDQVEIIGIINEKPQQYAQIVFKHLVTKEEKKGLCMLAHTINQFQLTKLQSFQKKSLALIDIEGKDIDQVWLNSL